MTASVVPQYDRRAQLVRAADWLAFVLVASLPWSTSATSILAAVWLVVTVVALGPSAIRREVMTAAGGLPVLLVVLIVAGTLWADAALKAKMSGVESLIKLLAIPVLIAQFRISERGMTVLAGFLASCTLLLLVSFGLVILAKANIYVSPQFGVPVKNGSSQSGEFVTCVFPLAYIAIELLERRRFALAAATGALIVAFLINIGFVATSRTALIVMPVLLVLLGFRKFSAKGMIVLLLAGSAVATVAWMSSSYLRQRVTDVGREIATYRETNERASTGERLEFWKKALDFIAAAPVAGHGTGTIPRLYAESAAGKTGTSGVATTNPHNQTFVLAIQLGLIGVAVLWAMWVAHAALFRGGGLAGWIGTTIVIQNVVGSVFNSHLSDFHQGWTYALGVGLAGGLMLKRLVAQPRT